MQEGGWLVAGTDPMDGIADITTQCTEGDPEYTDVYHEVYKLQAFHRSAHWDEVVDMVEKNNRQSSLATSAEDCAPLVSEVYRTHHTNSSRFRSLSR